MTESIGNGRNNHQNKGMGKTIRQRMDSQVKSQEDVTSENQLQPVDWLTHQQLNYDEQSKVMETNQVQKYGINSLAWQVADGGYLHWKGLASYRWPEPTEGDSRLPGFVWWVYNKQPLEGKLRVSFGIDGKNQCYFDFGLNFCGWRCAWVVYGRDMQGELTGTIDELTVETLEGVAMTTLYIGPIYPIKLIDARHSTRDYQLPFVNKQADSHVNSHWMSLYAFDQLYHQQLQVERTESETSNQEKVIGLIKQRYCQLLLDEKSVRPIDQLTNQFKDYGFNRTEEGWSSPQSIDFHHYFDIMSQPQKQVYQSFSVKLKEYVGLMLDLAVAWRRRKVVKQANQSVSVENLTECEMFMVMLKHLTLQGYAAGSGVGTVHHLGYAFRSYYSALLLMEEELVKEQVTGQPKLTEVVDAMAWFSGVGRLFYKQLAEPEWQIEGTNIDVLNTLAQAMLATILMMNGQKRRYLMEQYKSWLDYAFAITPGLQGGFKDSGSAFHHGNFYPAYVIDGLQGLMPVVYCLRQTTYALSISAHTTLRKCLMTFGIFCQGRQWPISLAARHMEGEGQYAGFELRPFKYLALTGSPDRTQTVDQSVAEYYLRLEQEDDFARWLFEQGYQPASAEQGHWAFNDGLLSIHRRNDWLVAIRGHNRYFWSAEIYEQANYYGRYISYGQIQVMSGKKQRSLREAGYVNQGWDWNAWPGTTTIHLPLEKLIADVRQLDTFSGKEEMLLSDESFAGGLTVGEKNGFFGMCLHEHPKYEGSHRARKSIFCFDNHIICLGSDIENKVTDYPTRTTLYQNYIEDEETCLFSRGQQLNFKEDEEKTVALTEPVWLVDNKGTGYYLPADQLLTLRQGKQRSKDDRYGQPTEGRFARAWLEHGKAPQKEGYHYLLVPTAQPTEMVAITETMATDEPLYEVWQKSRQAHIVYYRPKEIVSYVFFESVSEEEGLGIPGVVKAVDTPCLVAITCQEQSIRLSICDPDQRFYEGVDEEQYDENGCQREVSLYSRWWKANPSKAHRLTLCLEGSWQLDDNWLMDDSSSQIDQSRQQTKLSLTLQAAQKKELILHKLLSNE